jgi:hypothetical protein
VHCKVVSTWQAAACHNGIAACLAAPWSGPTCCFVWPAGLKMYTGRYVLSSSVTVTQQFSNYKQQPIYMKQQHIGLAPHWCPGFEPEVHRNWSASSSYTGFIGGHQQVTQYSIWECTTTTDAVARQELQVAWAGAHISHSMTAYARHH